MRYKYFIISIFLLINARAKNGITSLHLLASSGDVAPLATLMKHGARVNAQAEHGITPLHIAAGLGHKNMVKKLLGYTAHQYPRCI